MSDITEPLRQTEQGEVPDASEAKPVTKKPDNADEHYRLGGRPPLKTLAVLLVGPLVSQIVSGLYGVVTSMWMAKAMGDLGMSAISLYSNLDNIGRAFGFFLNTAASSKISALFGENQGSEAGQVFCDLVRCCFVCGAIVPLVLLPVCKPLGRWFGSDPETIEYGFQYLAPLLGLSSITCIYLLMCGCLQAEGRSILVGAIQMGSLFANMLGLNPLFLLVFKWKTIGGAFATILSELVPAVILLLLYFCGRFGVKPDWRGLFRKFSPHTMPAVKVGISQLIMNLSRSVPSIFLRKFMGMCAENNPIGTFDDAVAGFNAVARIYGITDSVRLAVSMGLLPSASYAFASHRVKRIFWLIFHACWINLIWAVGTCLFTAFGAKYLAMTISSSPTYLMWATPMLRTSNWEAPFSWIRNVVQTVLQALQYGTTATLYSFGATFVSYILSLVILYYTDNTNFVRMMYTFPMHSAVAVVAGLIIVFFPLRKLWRSKDLYDENGKPLEEAQAKNLEDLDDHGEEDNGDHEKHETPDEV